MVRLALGCNVEIIAIAMRTGIFCNYENHHLVAHRAIQEQVVVVKHAADAVTQLLTPIIAKILPTYFRWMSAIFIPPLMVAKLQPEPWTPPPLVYRRILLEDATLEKICQILEG
ncbi:hypothetical protein [Fischerella sp. PCC 9605]|uniref:hypothetical protein n=1 Tax=Fischerella sp. PCC 9605 TaxID=1173024 RepID=UPI0004B46411|nr:hypothetical protein [Fischerella sp. PCC 9605]